MKLWAQKKLGCSGNPVEIRARDIEIDVLGQITKGKGSQNQFDTESSQWWFVT